jgi:hypothetical protein
VLAALGQAVTFRIKWRSFVNIIWHGWPSSLTVAFGQEVSILPAGVVVSMVLVILRNPAALRDPIWHAETGSTARMVDVAHALVACRVENFSTPVVYVPTRPTGKTNKEAKLTNTPAGEAAVTRQRHIQSYFLI